MFCIFLVFTISGMIPVICADPQNQINGACHLHSTANPSYIRIQPAAGRKQFCSASTHPFQDLHLYRKCSKKKLYPCFSLHIFLPTPFLTPFVSTSSLRVLAIHALSLPPTFFLSSASKLRCLEFLYTFRRGGGGIVFIPFQSLPKICLSQQMSP